MSACRYIFRLRDSDTSVMRSRLPGSDHSQEVIFGAARPPEERELAGPKGQLLVVAAANIEVGDARQAFHVRTTGNQLVCEILLGPRRNLGEVSDTFLIEKIEAAR